MMSSRNEPILQQLALQELLKNEDLILSILEALPTSFFPPLFQEAFINRQTKIVEAMVIIWPFPCLPVGALMEYVREDNFQAVLDGLDWLINQENWPKRCNLQKLSLHDIYPSFWEGCFGSQKDEDSKQNKQEETERKKKPIQVLGEYSLVYNTLKDYTSSFMWWLKQRKDVIKIYFCKLEPKNK